MAVSVAEKLDIEITAEETSKTRKRLAAKTEDRGEKYRSAFCKRKKRKQSSQEMVGVIRLGEQK